MQYQWQSFNWKLNMKQIIDGGNRSFANVNSNGFSRQRNENAEIDDSKDLSDK